MMSPLHRGFDQLRQLRCQGGRTPTGLTACGAQCANRQIWADGAVDAVHLMQHGSNCRLAAVALLAPHFGPKQAAQDGI
jgi:hypothetical protein